MRSSPEPGPPPRAAGGLRRLRDAFERCVLLPEARRAEAAREEFAAEPEFLRDLLRLLDGADATTRFLVPPSSWGAEREREDETRALRDRVLARRWRLLHPIGSGSQGTVWEADDAVTGGRVAVKILRRSRSVDRIRRESAALRWLRLPGVVRLLDAGDENGVSWLAMDRIDGTPFPGRGRGRSWARVAPVALGLLEALARVHGAGVAHGDLKPHNVLVDARGVVTILDLGLAAALTAGGRRAAAGGTPGYVAPEVMAGAAPDALSDLYSAGVLLFEALSGRLPEGRRLASAAVPARVRRVVNRLIAPDRRARPASAAEAARMLGETPRLRRSRPWTARELRGRFSGHDWFLHLREDAARELFRRTRGAPALVEEELASWIRAGLARVEGGLVHIDRVALDRLPALRARTGRAAPRRRGAKLDAVLVSALREGDARQVVRTAVEAGRQALGDGRSLHALSAFELGAAAAFELGSEAALRRTLVLATTAALATATAHEIERALWLVERSGLDDDHAAALRAVLRAAAALQSGDRRTAWRLSTLAARTGPRAVQRIAWSVRVLVAQSLGLGVQRRTVAEGGRWARRHGTRTARRAGSLWRAWLLYREGRCAEAARIHRDAARTASNRADALRSLVDAAVAARDAGDDATAITWARAARRRAAALRLPVREARAYFTEREALSAQGGRIRPNLAALAAIQDLGFGAMNWSARMTESVIAWRRGRPDLARAILAPLATGRDASELALHELPVACLDAALGAPTDASRTLALARRAVRETAPALAVQCLALLCRGAPEHRSALRRLLRGLRLPARGLESTRVREVMSVREALATLGAD